MMHEVPSYQNDQASYRGLEIDEKVDDLGELLRVDDASWDEMGITQMMTEKVDKMLPPVV